LNWFKSFARSFPYAREYVTIALDTTGLGSQDFVKAVGISLASRGKVFANDEIIFNWSAPGVPAEVAAEYIKRRTFDDLGRRGSQRKDYYTDRILAEQGNLPDIAARAVFDSLDAVKQLPLVTFHGYGLDIPQLVRLAEQFDIKWEPPEQYYCAGLAEKAAQLFERDYEIVPLPVLDESLPEFYDRIAEEIAPGVRWSMLNHCVPKYDLLSAAKLTSSQLVRVTSTTRLLAALYEKHAELSK